MPRGAAAGTPAPKGLLELDRFSETSIEKWLDVSADLDQLQNILYFNLEPERRRLRQDLLKALQAIEPVARDLENWARIVPYRWTLHPLSAAGSLTGDGGRFNPGTELDGVAYPAWPALYLAEDQPTAFREKFQIPQGSTTEGLTPEELSLSHGHSYSTVSLNGKLTRIFPLTPETLAPISRVFAKIKMPAPAERIKSKLKIRKEDLRMLTTGKQLHDAVAVFNWRMWPSQFGLPAPSHILAELIRAADFEAIAYQSSKGDGVCLAVFVDRLAPGSFIEISGAAPPEAIRRLDVNTAEELAGWAKLGLKPPRS